MKILIYGINYFPELTGVGKYTGEMCEWLVSRGHEVEVITAVPYYPEWKVSQNYKKFRYKNELIGGVKIWRCPLFIPKRISFVGRIFLLMSFSVASFPILIYKVALSKPSVLWVVEPSFLCALSALFAAKFTRLKIWLHIQDFEIDAALRLAEIRSSCAKSFLHSFEKGVMNRFDRVSTISNEMMQLLSEKGVKNKVSIFFPNWVDTKEIKPINACAANEFLVNPYRKNLNLSMDSVVLLYSGNIGEKQGLDIIIEAARKLQHIAYIKFVICGAGSGYLKLKNTAMGLHNIHWLPLQPKERLNELLNMADIHLLPQTAAFAGLVMPSKLLGIFASGRPVIACANEGSALYEAVNNNGINVSLGNAMEFYDAIVNLSQNKNLREILGNNARKFALLHFDKEKILRSFESNLMILNNE